MIEAKADAETLAPGMNGLAPGDASGNIQLDADPIAATAADPKGDVHKPR